MTNPKLIIVSARIIYGFVLQQEAGGIRGRLQADDDHPLCAMVSPVILCSCLKLWKVIQKSRLSCVIFICKVRYV